MPVIYHKSESDTRPALTERGKKTMYLRKNITEKQREDEMTGETKTYYEYDEAALSFADYEIYVDEQRLDDIETVIAEIIGGGDV